MPVDRDAGTWEVPGGRLEPGEEAQAAAVREWQEETGFELPPGEFVSDWMSVDGVYQGFVYRIAHEADLPITAGRVTTDDPDGEVAEALAWWDAAHFHGNPALRPALAANLVPMMAALAMGSKAWSTDEVTQERIDYEDEVARDLAAGLARARTFIRRRLRGEITAPEA
jgi:8-oxo-dGTP pyrophosphatase MutT (NUDIX family)